MRLVFGFLGKSVGVADAGPELAAVLEQRLGRLKSAPDAPVLTWLRPQGDASPAPSSYPFSTMLWRLEHEILDAIVAAHPDLFWFHAGAAERDGRCVLVAGISGSGKSTFVLELCRRGWRFLSDDLVPLNPCHGTVHPFPRTPSRRKHAGISVPSDQLPLLSRNYADWSSIEVCSRPAVVAMLVFPTFKMDAKLSCERLSPSDAAMELGRSCVNFRSHAPEGLQILGRIVKSVPALRVLYSSGSLAAEALDRAWRDSLPAGLADGNSLR